MYLDRGPIEREGAQRALVYLLAAAQQYVQSTLPKPFGQLQEAIRRAKHASATHEEILLTLRHYDEFKEVLLIHN